MQQIGRWLYLGVDKYLFERLAESVPEIVPRLTTGCKNNLKWRRYW